MKSRIIVCIVVLAAITLISGVSILAFASPGTEADPFVTLSYLTSIFKPQVMADVTRIEQELTQKFETRITELERQLQSSQGSSGPATVKESERFTVITLRRNQSLTCKVGTEIMLRVGSATGFGTQPALVNYTTGETLAAGSSLTTNHMYLVTLEGNGIRSTADTTRVLVRGDYHIS